MSLSVSRSTAKPSEKLQSIADYFLYLSKTSSKPVSSKKLQKLVYYAQAWHLVFNHKVMFPDPIEAWLHGPAVRKLWHLYRDYGFVSIPGKAEKPELPAKELSLLDEIWRVYGKHEADYLEALTHSEKPWQIAREGLEANQLSSIEIDPNVMEAYYTELNGQKVK